MKVTELLAPEKNQIMLFFQEISQELIWAVSLPLKVSCKN